MQGESHGMASVPAQVNVASMNIPVKILGLKSQERKIAENRTLLVIGKLPYV